MKKLLVCVDYQKDFVDGALGFEGAEMLEESLVNAVERTLAEGGYVLFTRDTHGEDYLATREGQALPVPHCIAGTEGHQLYGRLHQYEEAPRPHTAFLDKPTFGSPHIGKAAEALCDGVPDEVVVCGVVTDICVVTNTLMLHSFFPEAAVGVAAALCGSGNMAAAEKALDLLNGMGIETPGR